MALTQKQSDEKARFAKLGIFLIDEVLIYKSLLPFKNEADDFETNYLKFDDLAEGKIIDTSGETEEKTANKLSIAESCALYCGTTRAFAKKIGNLDLAAQMWYSKSDILDMKDTEVLGFVNNLVKTITPLLADIVFKTYGITALQLSDLGTLATTFNGEIGHAGMVIHGATVSNRNLNDVIKLLQGNIEMMSLLLPNFQKLQPDFVAGFNLNSKTIDLGVHHGGVMGKITLETTGAALSDIKVEIVGTLKNDISDVLGEYAIIKVSPCTAIVQASGDGVVMQQKVHTFHRGKIEQLDFVMVAIKE